MIQIAGVDLQGLCRCSLPGQLHDRLEEYRAKRLTDEVRKETEVGKFDASILFAFKLPESCRNTSTVENVHFMPAFMQDGLQFIIA